MDLLSQSREEAVGVGDGDHRPRPDIEHIREDPGKEHDARAIESEARRPGHVCTGHKTISADA